MVIAIPPSAEACGIFYDPPGAVLLIKDMERTTKHFLVSFARHFESPRRKRRSSAKQFAATALQLWPGA
jgi:hypothetical protein